MWGFVFLGGFGAMGGGPIGDVLQCARLDCFSELAGPGELRLVHCQQILALNEIQAPHSALCDELQEGTLLGDRYFQAVAALREEDSCILGRQHRDERESSLELRVFF